MLCWVCEGTLPLLDFEDHGVELVVRYCGWEQGLVEHTAKCLQAVVIQPLPHLCWKRVRAWGFVDCELLQGMSSSVVMGPWPAGTMGCKWCGRCRPEYVSQVFCKIWLIRLPCSRIETGVACILIRKRSLAACSSNTAKHTLKFQDHSSVRLKSSEAEPELVLEHPSP